MRLSNSAAAPSQLRLFSHAVVAIDGAKFKGVNSRDRNFTKGKLKRRVEHVEASIERYLHSLEAADLQEGEYAEAKASSLRNKKFSAKLGAGFLLAKLLCKFASVRTQAKSSQSMIAIFAGMRSIARKGSIDTPLRPNFAALATWT
jgi:hypothetical protein